MRGTFWILMAAACASPLHASTSAQCDSQNVPPHAYLVPPLLTGLSRCEWLCFSAFARCPVIRASGAYISKNAPTSVDECSALPHHGAVLHVRMAVLFDILTAENTRFAFDRAAGVAHYIEHSNAIPAQFPYSVPCSLWMQNPLNRNATWPRLVGVFDIRKQLLPVTRPHYREKVPNIPTLPDQEDTYSGSYTELEILLYTHDVSLTMSEQASRLRDALAMSVAHVDSIQLLAIGLPTASWLSMPRQLASSETVIAAITGLGISWIMMGFLIAMCCVVFAQRVRCTCASR
jgi:hypothetical protein